MPRLRRKEGTITVGHIEFVDEDHASVTFAIDPGGTSRRPPRTGSGGGGRLRVESGPVDLL